MKEAITFISIVFSVWSFQLFAQSACSTPGEILNGSSSVLDRNGDGFFSIYTSSGFTLSKNEYTEFEILTGSGGDNLAWTRLPGTEPSNDLNSGGGCGKTDLVTDSDGGSDYAYYSIVDPDGIASNGDELLLFALRIANRSTGNFGFSFLIDTDNNCASVDTNEVCGNPCFEYEIQLATSNSGGDVELYAVDGCYGTSDCDVANGGDATICAPCNSEGIQVCVDSTDCGNGGALWVYYINFSQIPGVSSGSSFSLTPASNTSGNQIIYKSANVSDFGGLNDIGGGTCNCAILCIGDPCSSCEQDCALSCSSGENTVNPILPLNWVRFYSHAREHDILLKWEVGQEVHVREYLIERKAGLDGFSTIGQVGATKLLQEQKIYSFTDQNPYEGKNQYRIKQYNLDGTFSYSPIIEATYTLSPFVVSLDHSSSRMVFEELPKEGGEIRILTLQGKIISLGIWEQGQESVDLSFVKFPKGIFLVEIWPKGKDPHIRKMIHISAK